MHPLIAQCLRRKVLNEERLTPVLHCLRVKIPKNGVSDRPDYRDEKLRRIGGILVYLFRFLNGNFSRELVLDVLDAMNLLLPTRQATEQYEQLLDRAIRHCVQADDLVEISLYTTLGHWTLGNVEKIEAIYRRQKERLTVPRKLFLDFCLYAGSRLTITQNLLLAEEALREVLCDEATPAQKATAYYHLCANSQFGGAVPFLVEIQSEGTCRATAEAAERADGHRLPAA